MKRLIVVWASVQYAIHVDGATIHVTGPDKRQVEFGDGTTSFATLSGGEGFINSTVTVNAPDFVTMTGTSVNEMITLIRNQQTTIVSQQVEIEALKQFVGMMPPSMPSVCIANLSLGFTDANIGNENFNTGANLSNFVCGVHGYETVSATGSNRPSCTTRWGHGGRSLASLGFTFCNGTQTRCPDPNYPNYPVDTCASSGTSYGAGGTGAFSHSTTAANPYTWIEWTSRNIRHQICRFRLQMASGQWTTWFGTEACPYTLNASLGSGMLGATGHTGCYANEFLFYYRASCNNIQ